MPPISETSVSRPGPFRGLGHQRLTLSKHHLLPSQQNMTTRTDLKDTIEKFWSAANHLNRVEIYPDISNDVVNHWKGSLLEMEDRAWTASIELQGRTPSDDSLSSLGSNPHSVVDSQSPTDEKQLRNTVTEWIESVEVSPLCKPAISKKSGSSPSESAHPAPYSPNTTHSPTSLDDLLATTCVSLETVEKWKGRYNRQHIPVMNDDAFYQLVADIAQDAGDSAEIERAIKSSVIRKGIHLQEQVDTIRYDIFLPGAELFPTNIQKVGFLSILRDCLTVHDVQFFVAKCLPDLVKNSKIRRRNRSKGLQNHAMYKPELANASIKQTCSARDEVFALLKHMDPAACDEVLALQERSRRQLDPVRCTQPKPDSALHSL